MADEMIELSKSDLDVGILDCPFCGSSAEIKNTWTASYWVQCELCGAEVSDPKCGDDDFNKLHHVESAKRAIHQWNCRT